MERIACENALQSVMETYDDQVDSFTTDRSKSIATMMIDEFPTVIHYLDSWHFIRSLALDLMKRREQKQFAPMKPWFRSFINHVYWSIQSSGDGDTAKEKLLSFFLHITDIHEGFENCEWFKFRLIKSCEHSESQKQLKNHPDYLNLNDEAHLKSMNVLMAVLQKGNRIDAIKQVSPYFATSSVESFNSRAAHYASKKVYYSLDGFKNRTQIAILDWNSKQLDEMNGTRVVIGEKRFFNKSTKQYSFRKIKTEPDFSWRNDTANIGIRLYKDDKVTDDYETGDDDIEYEDEQDYDSEVRASQQFNADELWNRLELCGDIQGEDDMTEEEQYGESIGIKTEFTVFAKK
ncbi:hypothetical protein B9Z55_003379 [Caenorhabditis nigoni]|nr:hypothetical protein B9Z55_003379 [Caenorhabditis nigoni]